MTDIATLDRQRYLSLATFRRSGAEVRTPVWFAATDGKIYVFTAGESGKVKRLRHSSRARIAPSDMRGNVRGEWSDVTARIITDPRVIERAHSRVAGQVRLADVDRRPVLPPHGPEPSPGLDRDCGLSPALGCNTSIAQRTSSRSPYHWARPVRAWSVEPLRGVLRSDRSGGIRGHHRRRRDVRQRPAIRPSELELSVGPTLDLVALLVHRAVMPAAQ